MLDEAGRPEVKTHYVRRTDPKTSDFASLGATTVSTLQEQLDRLIKRKGEQDPLVQVLRNQIAAEISRKGVQELYLTGAVSTSPQSSPLELLEQIMTEQEQKSPTLAAKQRRLLKKLEQAHSDPQK